MTSNQAEAASGGGTAGDERPQRGQGHRGRGRSGTRGRGDGHISQRGVSTTEMRRGRGGRGGRGAATAAMSAGDLSARFGGQRGGAGGEQGEILAGPQRKRVESGGGEKRTKEGEVEAEVCWICASPIEHESIAPCNHRTCHICCLRMRALYKDKNCAHCRVYSLPSFFLQEIGVLIGKCRHRHHTLSSRTIQRNGMKISRTRILQARTRILGSGMRAMISERTRYYC
jgi:E3 ubiquitin-protein ligase ZNF598